MDFQKKINELQHQVDLASAKISGKDKCIPKILIAGIIVPILAWGVLYFLQPSFVQKQEQSKYVKDNTKLFYWTVFITIVLWIAMYLFTYCSGYVPSMICSKK